MHPFRFIRLNPFGTKQCYDLDQDTMMLRKCLDTERDIIAIALRQYHVGCCDPATSANEAILCQREGKKIFIIPATGYIIECDYDSLLY